MVGAGIPASEFLEPIKFLVSSVVVLPPLPRARHLLANLGLVLIGEIKPQEVEYILQHAYRV